MSDSSTLPEAIGMNGTVSESATASTATWSFGSKSSWVVGDVDHPPPPQSVEQVQNASDSSTAGPQVVRDLRGTVVRVSTPNFGKRAFQPIGQWEGVVQSIKDSGFRGRVTEVDGNGHSRQSREFTEFYFEDLANESDRELVQPGAVFYWTVGRGRNDAGTIENRSLVRFRRLPPPSAARQRLADLEADSILRNLGPQD
jgi:hypothetical protein